MLGTMTTSNAGSLYLAAVQPRSGKSLVALGLMEVLSRRVDRLGYFRPVVPSADDHRIVLMRDRYQLGDRASFALTDEEADQLLATGDNDEVFKRVIATYRDLAEQCGFVVIEGTDQTGAHSALEFEFNAQLATHLGASVVALVNGRDHTPDEVVDAARAGARAMEDDGARITAMIANRVAPDQLDEFRTRLDEMDYFTAVVPEDHRLGMPSLGEIAAALDARPVHATEGVEEVPVTTVKVAAMSLPNLLDRLEDGALVVAPGDRPAVLVGVLASRMSSEFPDVAGILLSGGFDPDARVMRLLEGIGNVTVPIYATPLDTHATVQAVDHVRSVISVGATRKIATALGLFEDHVDIDGLLQHIEVTRSETVTPLMFEFDLIERARANRKRIVLPEGTDPRILEAASLLARRQVADLVLLGDPEEIRRRASGVGADISTVDVVDPATSPDRHRYAEVYVEARSHKGMVLDRAEEVMGDVSYFGTMMVHLGDADGMVSGAAHTTAHTIRPAFEFVKTRPGVSSVSSVFLMCLADRVLVYGDCAVIPNPTPEQLADIATSSAATAELFGIDPVVAMLSYSTGGSGSGEDVERVRRATELAREAAPDLDIEGPIQYDAAVDAGVGQQKLPESSVAGRATVFVFPDLNTGNNTYKAVQRSAGAVAIGPILQGLNKPVNDLSRGCLVADIVNTVAITAIQAQEQDQRGAADDAEGASA
jgi:phosphate acetyltransferase